MEREREGVGARGCFAVSGGGWGRGATVAMGVVAGKGVVVGVVVGKRWGWVGCIGDEGERGVGDIFLIFFSFLKCILVFKNKK